MSLNPEAFRLYHQRLAAMTVALNDLPQPVLRGRACALGTLTSMLRRIDKMAIDWETRAITEINRQDVTRDGLTLRHLRSDEWVVQDFEGVTFDLPETGDALSYSDAVAALEAAQVQAVA